MDTHKRERECVRESVCERESVRERVCERERESAAAARKRTWSIQLAATRNQESDTRTA